MRHRVSYSRRSHHHQSHWYHRANRLFHSALVGNNKLLFLQLPKLCEALRSIDDLLDDLLGLSQDVHVYCCHSRLFDSVHYSQ